MARIGKNIYQRSDERWEGRYIAYYTKNGKAKYRFVYGKTFGEVNKKLETARAQFDEEDAGDGGNRPAGSSPEPGGNVPLEEVAKAWLKNSENKVKESSCARYRRLVFQHILPRLGTYTLGKITTTLVEEFISELLTRGRVDGQGGLSSKMVSDIWIVLKSIFNYAKDSGYPIIRNMKRVKIKRESKPTPCIDKESQEILTAHLFKKLDRSKFGVLLSLYMGIRIGELCALRCEDIDLKGGIMKIRRTIQRIQNVKPDDRKTKVIITEPKSSASNRDIPIPEVLIGLFEIFMAEPNAFFMTGLPSKHMDARTMQNRFKQYLRDAGLEDIHFHAIRHTFATRCAELGFEIKSLSEVMGHSDVKITLSRYIHSSMELKREQMEKLAESIPDLMKE
jgi:integrase